MTAKGLTPSKQEATCKRQGVMDVAISERSMTFLQIFISAKYEIDQNRMVWATCIASWWRSVIFPILGRRIAATLKRPIINFTLQRTCLIIMNPLMTALIEAFPENK